MSRIGKQPISIPDKVKVTINGDTVSVEGPKGKVQKTFAPVVKVTSANLTAFSLLRQCLDESISNRELRRLFHQGGIRVDEQVIKDVDQVLTLPAAVKVGKRKWFRVEQQ